MERRPLGETGIEVSVVALGCWPISGMTTVGVNDAESLKTIRACFELGINHLDTAYGYGAEGESERLIAEALGERRDEMVIATKGGIHWGPQGERVLDGSPKRLRWECEESLRRLNTDRVELYYLHAPDPKLPVAESAGAIKELIEAGTVRAAGASNCTVEQLEQFASACPLAAVQPSYSLLDRRIERDILPWCRERNVAVMIYWPLLKGLLAGKLARDHVFAPGDGRAKYPMFQGREWQRNQDFLDCLREIAANAGKTVAQLAINWTLQQPGITCALCGARRPEQIRENAGAAGWKLTGDELARVNAALGERGEALIRPAV
jgi:aryl-alcohol dehydrogenase-like predicted oxidoreductase